MLVGRERYLNFPSTHDHGKVKWLLNKQMETKQYTHLPPFMWLAILVLALQSTAYTNETSLTTANGAMLNYLLSFYLTGCHHCLNNR